MIFKIQNDIKNSCSVALRKRLLTSPSEKLKVKS